MVSPVFLDTRSVALVDAMNLLLRIYFSVSKGNPLKSETDLIESCCQIFFYQIGLVVRKYSCDRLFIVFDHGGSMRKKAILESYKATRTYKTTASGELGNSSEETFPQLKAAILRLCREFNITTFCEYGIEADDMIGVAVEELTKLGKRIVIVSNDSDFLQLLTNANVVCSIPSKSIDLTGPGFSEYFASCTKSKGVFITPSEYLFYKALVGDTSDNIEGISRLGYKTLYKLMQEQLETELQETRSLYATDTLAYLRLLASRATTKVSPTKLEKLISDNLSLLERNYKLIELSSTTASTNTIHLTLKCLQVSYSSPNKKSIISTYNELFPNSTSRVLEFVSSTCAALAPTYH